MQLLHIHELIGNLVIVSYRMIVSYIGSRSRCCSTLAVSVEIEPFAYRHQFIVQKDGMECVMSSPLIWVVRLSPCLVSLVSRRAVIRLSGLQTMSPSDRSSRS